jgi:predicted dehydrogenase
MARFDNGFTATVQGSWVPGSANNWYLDLYGSEGRLTVETPPNDGFDCHLNLSGGRRGELAGPIAADFTEAFRRDCTLVPEEVRPMVICGFVEGFIRLADAINDDTEAYPNFEDGYRLVTVCEAAAASYRRKEWVRVAY